MIDPFLDEIFVSNAIAAAFGHNAVYASSCRDDGRRAVRKELAAQIRSAAGRYKKAVPSAGHVATIARISDAVSAKCAEHLVGARLRYGTVQKAFNLYLKFLWRSGKIAVPPHCPIDRGVLKEVGIEGSFTKCDDLTEYVEWIDKLTEKAKPESLAAWENKVWLDLRNMKSHD